MNNIVETVAPTKIMILDIIYDDRTEICFLNKLLMADSIDDIIYFNIKDLLKNGSG